MRPILVPVLLLIAVALVSSKVLPLLSTSQLRLKLLGIEGQQNDNTYSFKDKNTNIFYNIPIDSSDNIQREFDKSDNAYSNADNNRAEYNLNIINKKDNRNGEGFRKEQWHNYPRQLDRLQKLLNKYQDYDRGNIDPNAINMMDQGTINDQYTTPIEGDTNDFLIDSKLDPDAYDLSTTNNNEDPISNLKLRLTCLSNSFVSLNDNLNPITRDHELNKSELKEEDKQIFINRLASIMKILKNIRLTETPEYSDTTDDTIEENRKVTKRIFSLWSRVQGLSHKGHEILQRRRHMHTFYGMPDSDGSRVLTAETRAILMRPPGSPLRWG